MKYGRPLVPEDNIRHAGELHRMALDSLARACIAGAAHAFDKIASPTTMLQRRGWSDDHGAVLLTRAAVPPHTVGDLAVFENIALAFMTALTPASAAAALFTRAISLTFGRAASIRMPTLAPGEAEFVGEAAPIKVKQMATTPGPTMRPYKLATICVLTREMVDSSNSEAIVRQALIESVGQGLDKILFDDAPEDTLRPAGLRSGVAALPRSTAPSKNEAMIDDLAALAQSVAPLAANGQIAFVASSKQATSIALRMPRELTYPVMASGGLADGMVLAIALPTLVSAIEGVPRIDSARESVLHMEDAAPTQIVDDAGTVASPVGSIYQTDSVALRVRMPLGWVLRAPGVAWTESVEW